MRFTISEIARATSGTSIGTEVTVSGVGIDSRSVGVGDLFVPLIAERDGHQFIDAAIAGGAAAYLSSRTPPGDHPAVMVDDTTNALAAIGRFARSRLRGEVIGITGSVGKTSVKDLATAVFGSVYSTHSNPASFNNEIGVPLTLANTPEGTEVVIQEMGARGMGDISHLCGIAVPTAAVVTVVAAAHTSEFSSLDEIAIAKGELVEAVGSSGFVVLNRDDPHVWGMAERTEARVVGFGSGADVRALDVQLDDALRPHFTLTTPDGSSPVLLELRGKHQVANALAAAAAGYAVGIDTDAIAAGLGNARGSAWRMEVTTRDDGVVVINDSYNANPTSMRAAFDALAGHAARRRFAVLGTMAELGDTSVSDHRSIGQEAIERGFTVITVSEDSYDVGQAVTDPSGAIAVLGELGEGDVVLVKASRAAGLERVAQLLLTRSGARHR
ncbi:MAG: UDP-N-acetylmuramoyl-tripeptide--D-alanyl-D-alanine ligase [Acidimicrobiia bacterium]|nr:UDP-N-acetylmuramoyl-tripeptide--D-alanyl-D-alanine ligase [Acidimicrobiia bacterium]